MTNVQIPGTFQDQNQVVTLIQHYNAAKADLETALQGQIDAVIDPINASIILLGQAQEAMQASEIRHRRLLLQMAALIFELEPDGTIVFINKAAFQILGYTLDELKGKNWWTTLCPAMSEAVIDSLNAQFHSTDVTGFELILTRKNGSLLIVELSSANHYAYDGTLTRIVGLGIDITERRELENERKTHNDELETTIADRTAKLFKANASLREEILERQRALVSEQVAQVELEKVNQLRLKYLAMISHELRTPLTSIKGFASTLLAKDVVWNAEKEREFITVINNEADKLSGLIDQLIDLSRLKAGRLRVYISPMSATDIVKLVQSQLNKLASRHELSIVLPPDLPYVLADSRRIGQVLVSLVDNAAKFSLPKSSIVVSATLDHDTFVQYQVRDQGPGIPAENRERVFEAFWEMEEVKSLKTKGAGLGLALSKGLVEAHGGRIWIADQTEPGTTVCFTLPVAPDSP